MPQNFYFNIFDKDNLEKYFEFDEVKYKFINIHEDNLISKEKEKNKKLTLKKSLTMNSESTTLSKTANSSYINLTKRKQLI